MKREIYISIILAIILIAGLGWYISKDLKSSSDKASTTPDGGNVISEGELPDAPIPSLNRKFVIPEIYGEEIITNTMVQYDGLLEALKENPKLRNEWLQLAILRKTVEDYVGAEEIWIYVTRVWPLDHVAFGNLGGLYTDYLIDYDKAEEYYKLAIERNPVNLQYSENLYNVYMYRMENSDKAVNFILEMKQSFPDQVYFPLKIAEHYRDNGDKANAKLYFSEALALAKKQKMDNVITYAEEELKKL